MSQEVIQIIEREIEVIEVVEKGAQGPVGPAGTTDFNELENVPSTFPPSAHTHVSADITDATSADTANKIAKRDASGNASFNEVTASVFRGKTNGAGLGGAIYLDGFYDSDPDSGEWTSNAGSIDLRGGDSGAEQNGNGGSITMRGYQCSSAGSINTSGAATGSCSDPLNGGDINTSGGNLGIGGSINTSDGGGSLNTRDKGSLELGFFGSRTSIKGTATDNREILFPDASGTLSLDGHTHQNSDLFGVLQSFNNAQDNAIIRADGTSGTLVQPSSIYVEDFTKNTQNNVAISLPENSYSFTASAATDRITVNGYTFQNNEVVRIITATSGTGIQTRFYNITDVVGNTFKLVVSTSPFVTLNVLADGSGTLLIINSLVLNTRNGSLISGNKPDGTSNGGNVRGGLSVDLQQERFLNTEVASGIASVIIGGTQNTASSSYGVVCGGQINTASGGGAVVLGGYFNRSSGLYSVCSGYYNAVSGRFAFVSGGSRAVANRTGIYAHAVGSFSEDGDGQYVRAIMRQTTRDGNPTEMYIDGSSMFTIPSGKVVSAIINIVSVKSDGSQVANFVRLCTIKNVNGTTSMPYPEQTIGSDNPSGTSILISANDTNDALRIQCTGKVGETWRWIATIQATEIGYGN